MQNYKFIFNIANKNATFYMPRLSSIQMLKYILNANLFL